MFVVLSAAGCSGVFEVVGVVAVVGGSCALSGFSVCYLLMLFCVLFLGFCGLQGRRGRPGSSGRRWSCGLRGSSLSSGVVAVVGGRCGSWGSLEVVRIVMLCLMLSFIYLFFFVSCRLVAVVGGHCRRRGSSGPLPSSGVVAVVAGSCVLSSFSGCCSVLMLFCFSFYVLSFTGSSL